MPCYRENRIKITLKNNASKFAHSPPFRQNIPNSRVFKGYFPHFFHSISRQRSWGQTKGTPNQDVPSYSPSLESKGYG